MTARTLLAILYLQTSASAFADGGSLFDSRSVLDLELKGPIATLVRDKQSRQEMPFVLRAGKLDLPLTVRTRGKSRMRVCQFPLLTLNLAESDAEGSIFEGHEQVKLVPHCGWGKADELNTLEEYAAYRILNVLTDVSRRVRLLRLTYVETDRPLDKEHHIRYAFVIEPKRDVAARLGGAIRHVPGVSLQWFNDEHMALVYIFQYLIGNTDWSLVKAHGDDTCCHNGDLIAVRSELFLLPYDFDLAGVVNAAYARPDPSLRINRVSQRLYRGFCLNDTVVRSALRKIKAKEREVIDVVATLPQLTAKGSGKTIRYLERFFQEARDEPRILDKFRRQCQT